MFDLTFNYEQAKRRAKKERLFRRRYLTGTDTDDQLYIPDNLSARRILSSQHKKEMETYRQHILNNLNSTPKNIFDIMDTYPGGWESIPVALELRRLVDIGEAKIVKEARFFQYKLFVSTKPKEKTTMKRDEIDHYLNGVSVKDIDKMELEGMKNVLKRIISAQRGFSRDDEVFVSCVCLLHAAFCKARHDGENPQCEFYTEHDSNFGVGDKDFTRWESFVIEICDTYKTDSRGLKGALSEAIKMARRLRDNKLLTYLIQMVVNEGNKDLDKVEEDIDSEAFDEIINETVHN